MAQFVKEVMTPDPVSLAPDATAAEAARQMRDNDTGAILIADGGTLQGIVTDRDIVVRCVADRGDISSATLADACSPELVTVSPDTEIREAARIMADRAVRRLPVVEDGRPVGIVSLGDLAVEQDPESALGGISAASPDD
jgi:CBS domain-containing protein